MALNFIEILKAIFLGVVEGITEWLPISSTGHMLLVDKFITLNMSEAFKEILFCCHSTWGNTRSGRYFLEENVSFSI